MVRRHAAENIMQNVEPDWDQIFAVCWLLIWRGVFGGAAIGFVLGLIVNMVLGLGFGVVLGSTANLAMGAVTSLIWWPFVVRMDLKKKYKAFRIALVPLGAAT
jgi:hypothetical protein